MGIQLKRSFNNVMQVGSDAPLLDPTYVLEQGQIGVDMGTASASYSNFSDGVTTPFKIKIGDGNHAWNQLPYASYTVSETDALLAGKSDASHTHSGYLSTTGTAAAATKLATARTVRTNLASTSTASFNGTANITPGVTGTLPVANGGTGVTSLDALKTALGIGSGGSSDIDLSYYMDSAGEGFRLYSYKSWLTQQVSIEMPISGPIEFVVYNKSTSSSSTAYRAGISCQVTANMNVVMPHGNNTDLGATSSRWTKVYADTGTIQTCDERNKYHISYIASANAAQIDATSPTGSNPDLATILDFVKHVEPVTFCYKSVTNPDDDATQARTNEIQLGVIAQDLKDHPLFPYIGTHEDIEQLNPDNNLSKQTDIYGVKPLPVAVAALTACKYLLSRVEMLEDKVLA